MAKERIYLFDTTLRDGQQTPGIDFSRRGQDRHRRDAGRIRLDYVEGGYPGANPTDTAFFDEKRTAKARFVAFGMTKRAGVSASNDPGPRGPGAGAIRRHLLRRQEPGTIMSGWRSAAPTRKTSTAIAQSRRGGRRGRQGGDGRLRAFLRRLQGQPRLCAGLRQAAYEAGARWVVLCDTNGGTQPAGGARDRRGGDRSRRAGRCVSASMPMTTPARRSPIRWRPSRPACARSRAR